MLAYRHQFHAGNFADVMKHALLVQLLLGLARKDTPFCYVDTHAGIGQYDLEHEWSRKNAEHAQGIARIWHGKDVPESVRPYLDLVAALYEGGQLRHYPGSPEIARRLLRAGDRMVLSELNTTDHAALRTHMAKARGVSVVHQDGYRTLTSHLPPPERRGLVLIDSSFDQSEEFARLSNALAYGHGRFSTGVFALWYPLMDPAAMRRFERAIRATGVRKILQMELSVHGESWRESLRGSGLLVVNPPFGFEAAARSALAWLAAAMAQTAGSFHVRWLVPE